MAKLKPILILWIVAAVLVTPVCGLMFSCGCDWPWNGLFLACNAILRHAPPPHCPWCVHPLAALSSIGIGLAAATVIAWKIQPASPHQSVASLASGLLAFLVLLSIGAYLTALAFGHPSFLGYGKQHLFLLSCTMYACL